MCVRVVVVGVAAVAVVVAVLEVGLGGRLDAVNAVEPDVVGITRIAMDHERYLYAVATHMGLLDPKAMPGKRHCGAIISHPEYAKLPGASDVF